MSQQMPSLHLGVTSWSYILDWCIKFGWLDSNTTQELLSPCSSSFFSMSFSDAAKICTRFFTSHHWPKHVFQVAIRSILLPLMLKTLHFMTLMMIYEHLLRKIKFKTRAWRCLKFYRQFDCLSGLSLLWSKKWLWNLLLVDILTVFCCSFRYHCGSHQVYSVL